MSRSVVQVVNHRSQKTSSGPSIPSYTPSFTPSYTASSLVQTGRPQLKHVLTKQLLQLLYIPQRYHQWLNQQQLQQAQQS